MRVVHTALPTFMCFWEEKEGGLEGMKKNKIQRKKKRTNKQKKSRTAALLLHPKSLFLTFPPSRHLYSILASRYGSRWVARAAPRSLPD